MTQTAKLHDVRNKNEFLSYLFLDIIEGIHSYYDSNTDVERTGISTNRIKHSLQSKAFRFPAKWSNKKYFENDFLANPELLSVQYLDGLADLYGQRADQDSKSLLCKIIAFRILGKEHIKLPLNTPEEWAKREYARSLVRRDKTLANHFLELETVFFCAGGTGLSHTNVAGTNGGLRKIYDQKL